MVEEMAPRVCPRCGGEKPLTEFYPRGDGRRTSYCKDCFNGMQVAARKRNPVRYRKVLDYNNGWLKGHREVNQRLQQRWRDRQRLGGAADPADQNGG